MKQNIVLTGFMGTGKTTAGRFVADRLGRQFIDMDAEIERRAGKSVADIFIDDGEAVFRQMEMAMCAELSDKQELVVATGGGVLVNPTNRDLLAKNGMLICLNCDVDILLERLDEASGPERPLLAVSDRKRKVKSLMDARWHAYADVPWQIDTSNLTIEDTMQRIIEIVNLTKNSVTHPNGSYNIFTGLGSLNLMGEIFYAAGIPVKGKVAIVTNPVVEPLYAQQVQESLHNSGYQSFICSMPDGEEYKTISTVTDLYTQFLMGGLDRTGAVLALGGGVVGDTAGFAAATFMRGVRLIQVPTTLLSMVDSSVGGKTGVDLPEGKNLAGVFKQPDVVVIDPTVLATLEEVDVRSGTAEAIKHGVLGDPELFDELKSKAGDLSSWWEEEESEQRLSRTVQVKIDVVKQDPYEQGVRATLNLGHTAGHAVEKSSEYKLRHGEAVSIGMVVAARIAVMMGKADSKLVQIFIDVLNKWGLPTSCSPYDVETIMLAMTHDKKKQGRILRWILPVEVGKVEIADDVPPNIIRDALLESGAVQK